MLQVQDPGGASNISPSTTLLILPSPLRDKVGRLTTVRFRGYSFHLRCGLLPPCLRFKAVVPAHLRVGGPCAPQNSVPGCWLGFAEAAIPGRLVLCASRRTAHRTVREPLDSHGSYHPAARGVTPAAHWENNFGSRLATFTNQRDALRFRL